MLCGSLSSPQFGHSWNCVAFSAWWLRRMFRFDGEVFLLGTAIAAPSHASQTTIKIATICASSQRASQMVSTAGGGRIVANRGPYSGTSRSCKGGVRSDLDEG